MPFSSLPQVAAEALHGHQLGAGWGQQGQWGPSRLAPSSHTGSPRSRNCLLGLYFDEQPGLEGRRGGYSTSLEPWVPLLLG